MSKILALTTKRHKLITDATELRASIKDDMTEAQVAEVNTKFDAAMNEADALAAEIDREQRLDNATRSLSNAREQRKGGREDIREEDEGGDRRGGNAAEYRKAFYAFAMQGLGEISPEQRAVLRTGYIPDGETRAQSVGTTTAGGYTVPTELQNEVIKTMKAYGPMADAAVARLIETESGNPIPFPTNDDTANTGVAIAENAEATGEGDLVFGQKVLGAYKFGSGVIKVSNELLADSIIQFEAFLGEQMGERIGRVINARLTVGTGSSQPQGIVVGSGLGTTAASATVIAPDELIDFYHTINSAYRRSPKFKFMFADTTLRTIRKLKDAQNRYLIGDLRNDDGVLNLAGITVPYVINDDVPAIATGNKCIVGGDFSKYMVRKVRAFAVARLSERYAEFDQVGFVGFTRIDGAVVDSAAIKHFKMA